RVCAPSETSSVRLPLVFHWFLFPTRSNRRLHFHHLPPLLISCARLCCRQLIMPPSHHTRKPVQSSPRMKLCIHQTSAGQFRFYRCAPWQRPTLHSPSPLFRCNKPRDREAR